MVERFAERCIGRGARVRAGPDAHYAGGFDSFAATASYASLGRDESGVADKDGSVPRTHGP